MRAIIERVHAGGTSAALTRLIRPGMQRARLRASAIPDDAPVTTAHGPN
jgi:hypothetical protein